METVKNVAEILVATSVTTATALSSLAAGELAVSYLNGVITDGSDALKITDVATGTPYKLVVKLADGSLQWSDTIYKGQETATSYTAYSALANQVDYVGYNGTSGAINVINSNIYTVRLLIQSKLISGYMQQLIKEGFYESDASATQDEIALNLTKSLVANYKREPERLITFERVNSGTSVATSAGALSFTYGSKYVSWPENGTDNDAGKYDTDGSSVAAGDFIRVGHATTKTYPVYKVVAVTGAATSTIILELDMEYQGTTESVAAASCGIIPAASEGNWGLKFSGRTRTFVAGETHDYISPKFVTTIQDFGTTTITKSTAATDGIGDYRWVAAKEFEFQMGENLYHRTAEGGASTFRAVASSSSTYGIFVIEHNHPQTNALGTSAVSKKQLYVACVTAGCSDMQTNLGIS